MARQPILNWRVDGWSGTKQASDCMQNTGRSMTEPRRVLPAGVESPGSSSNLHIPKEIDMTKTLTALILAAFTMTAAQAASHAGAAPMAAKPAASAAKMKKEHAAKHTKGAKHSKAAASAAK